MDDHVIRTLIAVLTTEEQALGLQQPPGIGQRPRPVISDVFGGGGGGQREPPAQQAQQQQQQQRVSPDQAGSAPRGESAEILGGRCGVGYPRCVWGSGHGWDSVASGCCR